MANMPKINLESLTGSALFRDMEPGEISILSGIFVERKMAEGATVFLENMPGESLFLVKQGTVQISRMIAEGEEKTLVILGPEDVFGEMAVLDGAPRSATARVAEDAQLLGIKKADFEVLCENHPKLGLKLMRNIIRVFSQRIRENNEEYRKMILWCSEKGTE
jgi:CRP-like cAMP-binding protein